jgi:hypothetical protein
VLDWAKGAVRSAIGAAEHVEVDVEADVETHSPVEIEDKLDEMIAALHRAADSAERHVDVIETLAQSLVPLTESVTRLTNELDQLLEVTAPLLAAEHDVSRVEGFFHRHRHPLPEGPPGGAGGAGPG